MSQVRSFVLLLGVSVIIVAPTKKLGAQDAPTTPSGARSPIVSTTTGTGPNGATLRCRDGSYPAPNAADAACETKGGVLVRFPLRRVPQPSAAGLEAASSTATARAPRADSVTTEARRPDGFVPYAERVRQAVPTAPPSGATLLCSNGTYVVSDTSSARCQPHGGVQLRFEPRRTP